MKISPSDVEHILQELEESGNKKFVKIAHAIRKLPDVVKQATTIEMTAEIVTFIKDAEKFYKFKLNKTSLVLKDNNWQLNMVILRRLLEISYRAYAVEMIVDTASLDRRADENRQRQLEIEPSLLKEEDAARLDDLKRDLEELEKEKTQLIADCPDILFCAYTAKIEYGDKETKISFNIPDNLIAILNEKKTLIPHYKLQLKPL